MKKIVTILMALLVGVNVYAADVSEFDIKGIKLGMSEKEVMERMPCKNPKIEGGYAGPNGRMITCKKQNFTVLLNHELKVYGMWFSPKFSTKPNFNTIESRLLKKYGYTNLVKNSSDMGEPSLKRRSFCWGSCSNGSTYNVSENKYKIGLSATFYIWDKNNEYSMYLELFDGAKNEEYIKFEKSEAKRKKIQEQKKASNIDF